MQAARSICRKVRGAPARVARGLFLVGLLGGALDCSRSERAPVAASKAAEPPSPSPALPADPDLLRARQQFRAEQDGHMRGELSPLARVDYVHLPVGENLVGSGAGAAASGSGPGSRLQPWPRCQSRQWPT